MRLFEHIKTEGISEVAYVTRSITGAWSISLRNKGNYLNRSIQSYEQLSDDDLKKVEAMGITVYDFTKDTEHFREKLAAMESHSVKESIESFMERNGLGEEDMRKD